MINLSSVSSEIDSPKLQHQHEYAMLGQLSLADLSPLQRMFLIADGTLTKLLESYLGESMQINKLQETVLSTTDPIEVLKLEAGESIIKRKVLLQGQQSGRAWLYADSIVALSRVSQEFQDKLLNSEVPIGKLWLEHRVETFKEIITAKREKAEHLAHHFSVDPNSILLSRTYRVFCNGYPVMLITEKFPISYFREI
jgi:chorismate-pyruvate lyase